MLSYGFIRVKVFAHRCRVEITVVGSGTAPPRLARRQSCVAVCSEGEMMVFAHGSGAVGGMLHAGLDPFAVNRIFFTHFHPDHTVDAVSLLFFIKYGADEERERPLYISGPEPFREFWEKIMAVWDRGCVAATRRRYTSFPCMTAKHYTCPAEP